MLQPVFLEYDREALDREYDNRKKVADAAAWLTRFAEESAAARAEIPCRLDVPYGTHPSERLDIFPPEPATPAPVHVFIHGGYWHRLDKKDFSYVARAWELGLRDSALSRTVRGLMVEPRYREVQTRRSEKASD
jgi:arylformamidase